MAYLLDVILANAGIHVSLDSRLRGNDKGNGLVGDGITLNNQFSKFQTKKPAVV